MARAPMSITAVSTVLTETLALHVVQGEIETVLESELLQMDIVGISIPVVTFAPT